MIFKNIVVNISKEDIIHILNLQDKVYIEKLEFDDNINIKGTYKFLKFNIDFLTKLILKDFKNNTIYK